MLSSILARLLSHNPSMRENPSTRYLISMYIAPGFPNRPTFKSWLLLHPLTFGLRFWARRIWNKFTYTPITLSESGGVSAGTTDHNLSNLWRIRRNITEPFIILTREALRIPVASARVLMIGPRNEAEILLFEGYGFQRKNITAIDLISVSPLIVPMDMHNMTFADDSFDVVYAVRVFPYSADPKRAVGEMVRVLRNGGLLVAGWGYSKDTKPNVVNQIWHRQGNEALAEMLGPNMKTAIWNNTYESANGTTVSNITRIQKTPQV